MMRCEKTPSQTNGFTPLHASTVKEEYTATMAFTCGFPSSRHHSEEQDQNEEDETKSVLDFETPGPATLLFCLLLHMLVTISWYYLNIDVTVPEHVTPGFLVRGLYDALVLVPMGLFSGFECLRCFAVLLCLRREDYALCLVRVALGGLLGGSVVVKYGLGVGVFDGGAWVQLCFWAATGVVPGAGAVALVGFLWDCLYWGCSRDEEEEDVVDEKSPLLRKEDV